MCACMHADNLDEMQPLMVFANDGPHNGRHVAVESHNTREETWLTRCPLSNQTTSPSITSYAFLPRAPLLVN